MPEPHYSNDGDTLSLRLQGSGILAALDAIEDACADHAEEWQFLRCELTRSPSRGQRVSIVLTLIRTEVARRLHDERRKRQRK